MRGSRSHIFVMLYHFFSTHTDDIDARRNILPRAPCSPINPDLRHGTQNAKLPLPHTLGREKGVVVLLGLHLYKHNRFILFCHDIKLVLPDFYILIDDPVSFLAKIAESDEFSFAAGNEMSFEHVLMRERNDAQMPGENPDPNETISFAPLPLKGERWVRGPQVEFK